MRAHPAFYGVLFVVGALGLAPPYLHAQGTLEDFLRADSIGDRLQGLVVDVVEQPTWVGESNRFWYRKSVEGGNSFVLVDAATQAKGPAFDHQRMASSITAIPAFAEDTVTAVRLPFSRFEFTEDEDAIEFTAVDSTWRCSLDDYQCTSQGAAPPERGGRGGGVGPSGVSWAAGPGQLWRNLSTDPIPSPDSTMEAAIQNYNVAVRKVGSEEYTMLSFEGSEGNTYTDRSLVWSPDSKKIAVFRVLPGYAREVHLVESSPDDQVQPKHSTMLYAKPGDVVDKEIPVILDVASGRQIIVDDELFPNAYTLSDASDLQWREDSRRLVFEYNQRGHQVYRVIEVDAETGDTRAVISEEAETFVDYSNKIFRKDIDDGREIIWMSERDGWNHLYLYDGVTGQVKNQITRGEWVVRGVDSVDVEARQIWFRASGMNPDQDPYFIHYYRINFDGTDLVTYTRVNGNHSVTFSPDGEFYVDQWSRVDLPPIAELRRTADQSLVMELERADASALLATGWSYPEVFVAKGRDGVTDIWGIIIRPTNFDPGRRYPVIESIYAGPHGSFTPKTFSTQISRQALAELGFIVVQMDGMGTNNRSKAFHDVAWQNIGDAGFPDRILWHQAVGREYDWYDTTRVGIFGTSAGGQNALGALLFHPEFYDVAVSAAGCHDNRMDKIWWNEAWMGWPIGPEYSASSNVDNAYRLEGKLFLIVGELDTNVDPSSTYQVIDALIKADKDFDFLLVPGADHTSGGQFGERKRRDFFVRHLLGVEPPAWSEYVNPGQAGSL
jgi:dipeptidyl aminopeptidase/acylaminoacyl peptidase